MAKALKPINEGGLQLQKYTAHKKWVITDSNYSDDYYSISILKAIVPDFNELILVSSSIDTRDTTQLDNISSSAAPELANIYQKIYWSSLNQYFYNSRGYNSQLFQSASIFSIPQNRFGDGVLPGSFKGIDYSIVSGSISSSINFSDIRVTKTFGKIVDTDIDTEYFLSDIQTVNYWGFNEFLNERFIPNGSILGKYKNNNATFKNIRFSPGIDTTGDKILPSGTKAEFTNDNSYIRIKHSNRLNFNISDNYLLSFWINLPVSQSNNIDDYNYIVSKSGTFQDGNLVVNETTSIYPFDIVVYNQNSVDSGKLKVSLSDGLNLNELTSSLLINDGNYHHIAFGVNNGEMELYIDGVLDSSGSINVVDSVSNNYDVILGAKYSSDFDSGNLAYYTVNNIFNGTFVSAGQSSAVTQYTNQSDTDITLDLNFTYNSGDEPIVYVIFNEQFNQTTQGVIENNTNTIQVLPTGHTIVIYNISTPSFRPADINLQINEVAQNTNSLSGSIDEFRIYKGEYSLNSILSLSNNDYLYGTAYQTNQIGTIFYNNGLAVVSDLRPKYKNIWVGNGNWSYGIPTPTSTVSYYDSGYIDDGYFETESSGDTTNDYVEDDYIEDYFETSEVDTVYRGFTTEFKSTKELFETSVLCTIGSGEFNVSTNPTLRVENNAFNTELKPFVSSSIFSPYFTTIGLYSPAGELLAVGKLGSAIKNRTDVDLTVKVRFDYYGDFGKPSYELMEPDDLVTIVDNGNGTYTWNPTSGF
jgi:hypothetical protein